MLGGRGAGFNPKKHSVLDVLVFSRTTNIKNYSAQPGFHNNYIIFSTLYKDHSCFGKL